MAYAVDLMFPGGAYSLSDGNPFRIESAEDLSPSEVIRLEQYGPTQDGAVDLGFRLAPRIFTLNLLFYASTATLLDTYRSTLFSYFKAMVTLTLRYTRDDGGLRYLTCVPVDDIDIRLVTEERPGHLHRASVRLRSADPRWYSAAKTPSYTGGSAQVWYTAGGVIGTANVMEHVEYPTNGQAWTYAGTITTSWTVAFRTTTDSTGAHAAFHAGTGALAGVLTKDARLFYDVPNVQWDYDGGVYALTTGGGGDRNFQIAMDSTGPLITTYFSGTAFDVQQVFDFDISGTARRWRSDRLGSAASYWANAMPKAAIYNKALSSAERIALDGWMGNTATVGTVTAVNSGDLAEYPLITINGPIINPVLTNSATGDVIDFTGVTLGTAERLTIDLRTGDKQVTNVAGSSVIGSVSSALQLADFYLAPSPIAAGGTNNIVVQGGSVSTTTLVTVTHYDRYMSF